VSDEEAQRVALEMPQQTVWSCKVGSLKPLALPLAADYPMRQAIQRMFQELTGEDAEFCFSGWGGQLTEIELAVVENRLPREASPPACEALSDEEILYEWSGPGNRPVLGRNKVLSFARAIERKVRG
jgi:hypothetical protein